MANILIIDDDGIVRDALSVFLMRRGHSVTTAPDGMNGILRFRSEPPDLVVLDHNLPFVSGSKVFAAIKRFSSTVPVVVLTGHDDPDEGAVYLKHGAAAFLSKGDGLSSVLTEIAELLGTGAKGAGGGAKAGPEPPGGLSPWP